MVAYPARGELRGENLQSMLEPARDLERVGAVLGRGFHQNAGVAADHGIAKARCGPVAYLRDVADPHGNAGRGGHDRLAERAE